MNSNMSVSVEYRGDHQQVDEKASVDLLSQPCVVLQDLGPDIIKEFPYDIMLSIIDEAAIDSETRITVRIILPLLYQLVLNICRPQTCRVWTCIKLLNP